MTTPAELVRGNCDALPGYAGALFAELLLSGPGTPGDAPVRPSGPAAAPPPGDPAAFYALTAIWEAIPRIEARLRYELTGHPGYRRGGSAGNFLDALDAIPKLAAGLDEDAEAWAARMVERLLDLARAHPAIDEAQRWRHLRGRPCPRCGCWFLKVLLGPAGQPDGRVECFGHRETGEPCRASWPGGLLEIAPDLED